MAGRFTDTALSAVRERIDLVDLIGTYVSLRQRGANWTGLCPFHEEKTPSFNVNPERGLFKCFGCGEGGDAFKFLMRMEGLTFPDAVAELAQRVGVELELAGGSNGQGRDDDRRNLLLDLNEQAAAWFRSKYRSAQGVAAREHVQARGLKTSTIETFVVGAAPDAWDDLVLHLQTKKLAQPGVEVGLIGKAEGGRLYDRLRNRVIFPIRDVRGRFVGFGGRTLGDDRAKYLNSPDSPVYDKSRVLYGLFEARLAIGRADLAIVCEGYFDVLAVVDAGLANAVATCGTALTAEQVRLLKRYSNNVALLFDSDEAGRNAARKALVLFLDHDVWATRVELADTKDPDDFLRKYGPEALRATIANARPLLDVVVDDALTKAGQGPRAPQTALDDLGDILVRLAPTLLAHVLRRMADRLLVRFMDLEQTWLEMQKRRRPTRTETENAANNIAEPTQIRPPEPIPHVEAELLRRFFADPETTTEAVVQAGTLEHLATADLAELLRNAMLFWLDNHRLPNPASLLDERSSDPLQRLLAEIVMAETSNHEAETLKMALEECLCRIEIGALSRADKDRDALIREALRERDRDYMTDLIRAQDTARKRISELQIKLRNHAWDNEQRMQQAALGR